MAALMFATATACLWPLTNPELKDGDGNGLPDGWSWCSTPPNGKTTKAAFDAVDGKPVFTLIDQDNKAGFGISQGNIPVTPGKSYRIGVKAKGGSFALYFFWFDSAGKKIGKETARTLQGGAAFLPCEFAQKAPEGAATCTLWLYSCSSCTTEVSIRDLAFGEGEATMPTEPAKAARPMPDWNRVKEIASWLPAKPVPALFAPSSDRAAWTVNPVVASNAITVAERQVAVGLTPFSDEAFLEFSRTGKRIADSVYFKRIGYLRSLILGECIENKGRFIPPLESALADFSAMKTWLLSACDGTLQNYRGEIVEIDLAAAAHALLYAAAFVGLGEKLTPQTRASVQAELKRRIFDPYRAWLTNADRGGNSWWMTGNNNWNAVCHAGVVLAALSVLPSAQERAVFVHGAELGMPYFFRGVPDDGYCTEGIGYWGYGFGNFVLLATAVKEATGGKLDWFDSAKTAALGRFGARMELMPGHFPAFADCVPTARPAEWIMYYMARLYDPGALSAWPSAPSDATDPQTFFLTSSPTSPNFKAAPYAALKPPAGDRLRDYYPIAGILNCRPADMQASNAIAVSLKGGHNAEEHNHNDLGSFVVSTRRSAYPILVDPGSEVYTRDTFSSKRYQSKANNSFGHSVPVVDGAPQRPGRQSEARILESNFSPAEDRFAIDITSAYASDVPELKSLLRRFTYSRADGGSLTVRDELKAEKPVSFASALISFGKVRKTAPDTLVFEDGGEALEVRVTASRPWNLTEERFTEDLNARRKALRLGIELEGKAAEATLEVRVRQLVVASGEFEGSREARFPAAPRLDKAIVLEAEDFSSESGGQVNVVKNKVNASGSAFMNWDHEGHALTWRFELTEAGEYGIQLRYASDIALIQRVIQIDGKSLTGASNAFTFAGTGGWSSTADNWAQAWLSDKKEGLRLKLAKGAHTLTMVNAGGSMNLDWVKVVPVK